MSKSILPIAYLNTITINRKNESLKIIALSFYKKAIFMIEVILAIVFIVGSLVFILIAVISSRTTRENCPVCHSKQSMREHWPYWNTECVTCGHKAE